LPPDGIAMLGKLLPPTGKAAQFTDESMTVGVVQRRGYKLLCLFNWDDQPSSISIQLSEKCQIRDLWTDEDLRPHATDLAINNMPAHSARLLACLPSED
jgi:alpha-galactosidase